MLHFPAEGRPNPVEGIRPPSLPPRSPGSAYAVSARIVGPSSVWFGVPLFTAGIQRSRCAFQGADHHRDAMAKPASGLDPLQSKPLTNNRSNLIHLVGCQHAKATHQFRMRDRDDVLRIEDARLEKPYRQSDFEI